MRIRDWSSDVCSSDLVPEAAVDVDIVVSGRAVTEDCLVVGVGDGRVAGTRLRIARDDVVAPAGQDLIVAGRALVLAQVVGVGLGIAFGAVGNRHGVARDGVVAAARPDGVVGGGGSPVVRIVVGLGRRPHVLIR